LFSKHTLMKI